MSGFNGAVEGGVLHGYDVVNNLTSTETDKPLSAAQGKALNEKLTTLEPIRIDYTARIEITSQVSDSTWYTLTTAGYLMISTKSSGGVIASFFDTYMSETIPANAYRCIFVFKNTNIRIANTENLNAIYWLPVVQ